MFHSIRNRLIALCVAITVISMLALSLATIYVARQNTITQVDASIGQVTRDQAESLAAWVRDKQRITGALAQAVDQPDDVARLMAAATQQAGGFDDAYVVYADKRIIFTHPMPAGYDGTARPWYQQASRTDGPAITPVYVDASTGKLVVSFVEAVRRGNTVTAVVGSDMHLDSMVKRVTAIQATPKSFAFLLDEQGNILAHPQTDLALKPVTAFDPDLDLAELQAVAQRGGAVEKEINGTRQIVYAANVAGTPWTLVVSIDYALANVPVTDMMKLATTITVLALLAAIALLTVTVRRQLRGLPQVQAALEDIASGDGDLTRRLPAQGKDELAQIGAAFNHFADKIANVLRQIREASVSVRSASLEIAAGNQDLSARTAQQASSLEETAAAMEQLTATVQHNAANAQQAASLAEDASGVAANSGNAMREVVQTMNGIDASARKIVDIISVIDGIAFQTNILALNAAVEAARAGEQGRGFAVVASEVRTLAQRSATAAREIKDLIETSVRQVDEGNALVDRAGGTMEQVVASVDRVTFIVREINVASQEQSTGIGEVNGAVNLMDQSTQQNSALVEEAAAAAQTLQEQAVHLAALVAEFKLEQDGTAHAVAPRRRMAAPLLAHEG